MVTSSYDSMYLLNVLDAAQMRLTHDWLIRNSLITGSHGVLSGLI
jgi:hypothetical protein